MPVDTKGLSVGELLERARAAHLEYRQTAPRRVPGPAGATASAGDPVACVTALDAAGTCRKAAEDLDPTFQDPAWETDAATTGVLHADLLTFFAEQLAKPDLAKTAKKISDATAKQALAEANGVVNG